MKNYQVTYSYSVTVQAEDENSAEDLAVEEVASDPEMTAPHNCGSAIEEITSSHPMYRFIEKADMPQ